MSDIDTMFSPSAQAKEAARIFKNAPTVLSVSSEFASPVSVFHTLSQHDDNGFLFESTEGEGRLARFSLLGTDPCLAITFKDKQATVKYRAENIAETVLSENPVRFLKEYLQLAGNPSAVLDTPDTNLPFLGGLVGFMGYGAVSYLEKIPMQEFDPFGVPDGHYGLYDSVVIFDHQYRRVSIVSYRGEQHARELLERVLAPLKLAPVVLTNDVLPETEIFSNVTGPFTKEAFVKAVQKTQEYIKEGQAFQIVLSQRFTLPIQKPAIDVYRYLQATNPSPYAYYLKCPDFVYLGSSPETFVRCQNGQTLLRAIAGTRPRGKNEKEDIALAQELRENEKEMAEHRMLVDLGRNDLGRVCKPGTIRIGEIACLTKYTHVMHLYTEIMGEVDRTKNCFDVFQSCFPAGTVSGAPKVRAMQLLAKLEPEQRGVYSGTVGYFDLTGNMDGAIAIRSALIKDGLAHVNAGAGIVFDSDPEGEYNETRNKAKSVLQAIKLAEKGK